jgi:hypothetical protein
MKSVFKHSTLKESGGRCTSNKEEHWKQHHPLGNARLARKRATRRNTGNHSLKIPQSFPKEEEEEGLDNDRC